MTEVRESGASGSRGGAVRFSRKRGISKIVAATTIIFGFSCGILVSTTIVARYPGMGNPSAPNSMRKTTKASFFLRGG